MSLTGFKLYVSNLSKETTDQSLEAHFQQPYPDAEIVWAQVCKDRRSGEKKGYGFVTFKDEEMGKKALEELHESELDGSKIDVEKSHQASVEKTDVGGVQGDDKVRLFVGGLPEGTKEEDLMELFAESEPIEAFMCVHKHPPCGFITIKRSPENLEKAQSHDGIYYKESPWRLTVNAAKPVRERGRSPPRGRGGGGGGGGGRYSRSRSPRRGGGGGGGGGDVRLFIGGLPPDCTERDILHKFRRYVPPIHPPTHLPIHRVQHLIQTAFYFLAC